MKNNLDYFSHEVRAPDHRKFVTLRAVYGGEKGWAMEARFWALNCRIADTDGGKIDTNLKGQKPTLARFLELSLAELDEFLRILEYDAELIHNENGVIWTDQVQEDLERAMASRTKASTRRNGRVPAAYRDKHETYRDESQTYPDENDRVEKSREEKNRDACSAREAEPVDNSPEPTVPQVATACLPAGYKTRIQEAVASSSSRISTAEYEDISQRIFTLYPSADSAAAFVAYVLERSQGKDVRNSGAMIRSALLGRPGFELWPEDYEASKRERRSETHREPTPLAPAPPACHCGGALKANRQIGQGQCVECGTFWEWDATLKEWIVSEAVAAEA